MLHAQLFQVQVQPERSHRLLRVGLVMRNFVVGGLLALGAAGVVAGWGQPSAAAPANPLLGAWRLIEGNPSSCGTTITFTPDTEASTNPDPSWNEQHRVSYNASPTIVYVMGSGGVVQYDITGPAAMQWHGTSVCRYQRAR